jgi:hypothetical protein
LRWLVDPFVVGWLIPYRWKLQVASWLVLHKRPAPAFVIYVREKHLTTGSDFWYFPIIRIREVRGEYWNFLYFLQILDHIIQVFYPSHNNFEGILGEAYGWYHAMHNLSK